MHSSRCMKVSNPYREFISRARKGTWRTEGGKFSFKPLSGIHLARTNHEVGAGNMAFPFQTPIGNSSRAHPVVAMVSDWGQTFQTPIGNSSRAHVTPLPSGVQPAPRFKPLSGIHLARTPHRKPQHRRSTRFKPLSGIHLARTVRFLNLGEGFVLVSNPYREFISRARP